MNALIVAKMLINESNKKNFILTITKLHKLLYIVYGTYLVLKKEPLFVEEDDKPACFEYGPIFKSVQREYKKGKIDFNEKFEGKIDDDLLNFIDSALDNFGGYSAITLSNWSHRDGSAWAKADKESDCWGNIINDYYIAEEFNKIVEYK